MKKGRLLHSELSQTIAALGHLDGVVIADAGLPIPAGPKRIDLALTRGIPSFADTLAVVVSEMQVERVVIAGELRARSPRVLHDIEALLPGTLIEEVSHEHFKTLTREARAVVRTGECTPYANILLVAGVVF